MRGARSLAGLGTSWGSLVCRAWHSSPLTAIPGPCSGQCCSPWPSCLAPVKHHGQKSHWCCRGRGLVLHSGSHNQMCAGFQAQVFKPIIFVQPSSQHCQVFSCAVSPALESAGNQRSLAQHSSQAVPWVSCSEQRQGWKTAPAACLLWGIKRMIRNGQRLQTASPMQNSWQLLLQSLSSALYASALTERCSVFYLGVLLKDF